MIDNGCCTYGIVTEKLVRSKGLPRIEIPQIQIDGVNEQRSSVNAITEFDLDVGGLKQRAAAYIVSTTYDYDMILGKSWLEQVSGIINSRQHTLRLPQYGITVRSTESQKGKTDFSLISAAAFQLHVRRNRREKNKVQIFAASLRDIEKAL